MGDLIVTVIASVDVIEPVTVAALGTGNDIVAVFDTGDERERRASPA